MVQHYKLLGHEQVKMKLFDVILRMICQNGCYALVTASMNANYVLLLSNRLLILLMFRFTVADLFTGILCYLIIIYFRATLISRIWNGIIFRGT